MNITLPTQEILHERLLNFSPESHFVQKFYPIIEKNAGRNLAPQGIILMLTLAIYDYASEMPPIHTMLNMRFKALIKVCVENEEVQDEVIKMYEEM
jgi:hypothetical protein